MKVADAHCDTLTKFPTNPFHTEEAHWNISKFRQVGGVLQYLAIFTMPNISGDAALSFAFNTLANFHRKKDPGTTLLKSGKDYKDDGINLLLSIEGASPVIDDLNNLHGFYKMGVRAMGLTWNHRNFAADGVDNDYGLTHFGVELVKEMESLNMIIDVSHLNENGFADVVKHTQKPFIASHSNAFAVLGHKRNLKDEQIEEIIKRGGFIGMNFYSHFIGNEGENLKLKLLKHIEHILKLGGGDVLGMGADFDGIDESPFDDVLAYKEIEIMLRNDLQLDKELIEKIMYRNLMDYTKKSI